MKRFVSMVLAISLLAQASTRLAWGLYYAYDKTVFEKNCENKDRPALCCEGKCQLRKIVASDNPAPKSPAQPSVLREIKDLQLFFEHDRRFILSYPPEEAHTGFPPYLCRPAEAPVRGIFKPPACA